MVGLLNFSANASAGRGQSKPTYATPKASTLMGSGNSNITDDQIRAFIKANKDDPGKILQATLDNNISINQYANAVGIDPSHVRSFVESKGIDLNPVKNNAPLMSLMTAEESPNCNQMVPIKMASIMYMAKRNQMTAGLRREFHMPLRSK